jgi:lysophospholipase L1-like esterase
VTRRPRLAAAVAALALAASACESGRAAGDGEVDLPDPVIETEVTTPVDYVAMGDSFSAGPFIGTMRTDPQGCARSQDNYPAFLADWLDVASYTDVTCSAATTRDLYAPMVMFDGNTTGPQVDALSAGTDLVTLGIGGNDFGLFGSIVGTCGALRDSDPLGAPCRRSFLRRAGDRLVDTRARDARRVEGRVARVLRVVGRRAPDAEVILVGYPHLLPERGRCAAVPFAAGDYAWGRRIESLLNDSLRGAAERAGATFVDLHPASREHDACAGEAAWVNGAQTLFGLAAGFHPFQSGMRGTAGVLHETVTGRSAPADQDARPPAGSVVRNPQSGGARN